MPCNLSLLGPPRLLDDRGDPIVVPSKTFALAAYLLLAGGGAPTSRVSIRQFLWGNSDTKTAAANLRKFLLRIRDRQREYGFELIHEERNHVRISSTARIDLAEFLAATASPAPVDLSYFSDLYGGELLEGLHLEEAETREWLQVQRSKLRDVFVGTVSSRLDSPTSEDDAMSLRIGGRRLIEVDPYNESAHRALMRMYAEESAPVRVRDLYRTLKQRLRIDLGVDPDPATTELYRALLPDYANPVPATVESAARRIDQLPLRADGLQPDASAPEATIYRAGLPRITLLPPPIVGVPDQKHQIASSLVEDITIGLCRFRSLSVIAPHTAMELSQNNKRALFRTYGIDYAVETQIQSRGGDPWLSVSLIDAVTRNLLWIEKYALGNAQEAEHYHGLSVRILSSVVDHIERAELARYDSEQNPSAYHFYLLGQRSLGTLDLPSVRKARRAFREAVTACPDFVPGIAGLARTLQLEWLLRAHGDKELLDEAARLAARSIEIDPDDARGYRELGVCRAYAGRFDESLSTLTQGEQRNPQYADLLNDFADALVHACEPGSALQKINQALELNPLCPDQYWWGAAGANYQLENYSAAVECMSRMRDQTPALRLLAASWGMLGDYGRAGKYARMTREIHPDFSISGWFSIVPFRDPKVISRYEEGLRAAGFN